MKNKQIKMLLTLSILTFSNLSAAESCKKVLNENHLLLGPIKLEKHTIKDAISFYGATKINSTGDAADFKKSVCFTEKSNKTYLILSTSELSGEQIASFKISNSAPNFPCSVSERIALPLSTKSGLGIFSDIDTYKKILGKPEFNSKNTAKWTCTKEITDKKTNKKSYKSVIISVSMGQNKSIEISSSTTN